MRINNINGTSGNRCNCGSWLDHWKNFSGQDLPSYCPVDKCLSKPTVGAHVQKDSSTDRGWYIVPLCASCNAETGKSLLINDWIALVSANTSVTCG